MELSNNHPVKLINTTPKKSNDPHSIIKQVEEYGLKKVQKSFAKSFASAIFAGAFIAIAFVFYITVTTGAGNAPWGVIRFAGGVAFSLGLILVVVCGGELFTSTVLSTVAWAQGRFTTSQLLKCWTRVYLGNLVGAAAMLALVITAQMHLLDGGEWGINALKVAQHKLEHTWAQAFALGILCNLLVCLGTWMTFSCKDTLTKSILLILPVAMFVSSGFEHSIANMFMVPLGLTIKAISDPAFYISHGYLPSDFTHLTFSNFIFNNLIPVTLGNIVGGGLFVGIGYWLIEGDKTASNEQHNTLINTQENNKQLTTLGDTFIMKNALNKLAVKDVMNTTPLVLTKDQDIYQALALLTNHDVNAAPIVNQTQQLIGFVSQQDILRLLWSEEYSAELNYQVHHAMQTEIITVDEAQPITALLEFMVVDKDKLFPVSDSGILTSRNYQSYDERLKAASANRPSIYPVLKDGKLCGIVTRKQLADLIIKAYTPKDQTETQAA
ncbi:formate transporter FocA [Psychromonas antarctica]|uniref:formate transporter FocA n=1 Tax=Psychromonas antarctica TaxID=67573 RepID=UPI001EE97D0F|nr:formate transporter FocA [Psychromonas antarctica]MCG6201443.1 formate transporter FocA [Psychromonas antarctica]